MRTTIGSGEGEGERTRDDGRRGRGTIAKLLGSMPLFRIIGDHLPAHRERRRRPAILFQTRRMQIRQAKSSRWRARPREPDLDSAYRGLSKSLLRERLLETLESPYWLFVSEAHAQARCLLRRRCGMRRSAVLEALRERLQERTVEYLTLVRNSPNYSRLLRFVVRGLGTRVESVVVPDPTLAELHVQARRLRRRAGGLRFLHDVGRFSVTVVLAAVLCAASLLSGTVMAMQGARARTVLNQVVIGGAGVCVFSRAARFFSRSLLVLPAWALWSRLPQILVLRKFHDAAGTRRILALARSTLGTRGRVITLSDDGIRRNRWRESLSGLFLGSTATTMAGGVNSAEALDSFGHKPWSFGVSASSWLASRDKCLPVHGSDRIWFELVHTILLASSVVLVHVTGDSETVARELRHCADLQIAHRMIVLTSSDAFESTACLIRRGFPGAAEDVPILEDVGGPAAEAAIIEALCKALVSGACDTRHAIWDRALTSLGPRRLFRGNFEFKRLFG